jgi:hypothetical protein
VQAIDAAVRFQDEAAAVLDETSELTGALCTNVILAREYLKEVEISPDQVRGGWLGRAGGVLGVAGVCGGGRGGAGRGPESRTRPLEGGQTMHTQTGPTLATPPCPPSLPPG